MTPQQFIKKWTPVALTERATAQSHFIDLCALLSHDDPIKADPTGEWFAFEKGVTKTGGGEGFADVWKQGFFAWEYKKKKRNLEDALNQLVRYAAALENPPLQVACDTDRFLIRTAWTNAVPKTYEFSLDDLADAKNIDILHSVFFDPEKLRPKETRAGITKEAADKFSTIALRLKGRGTPQEIAHFVNQLVFCFFAHSVKLLPNGFFPRLLKRASENPQNATRYFDGLFAAMQKGGEFDLTRIAHFNGGLFDGRRALRLDSGDIGLLVAAASLDWSQIDPTIFGTLFERFLDPEKRGQIGAHYTDPEKIMKIIEPVIVRPLTAEWAEARAEIEQLLQGKLRPPVRTKTGRRMTAHEAAEEARSRHLERLRNLTILDPACGSGNFLYLALQAVKDLELKANLECEALGLSPRAPAVGPEIVHGIEINPLAAELARTTIWIGDIQWGIRNAIYARPEPILRPLEAIECRDALLCNDAKGNVVEAEWPKAEFIVGNPPFLGDRFHRRDLGKQYTLTLRDTYDGRVNARADLVTYWFQKAVDSLLTGRTRAFGLVATKSIAKGASRRPLDRILASPNLHIFNAWTNEPWILDGALVRVALVCAERVDDPHRLELDLNGEGVNQINADLTSGLDLTKASQLSENADLAFQGVKITGPFDIGGDIARQWLKEPLNPNNRANSDVLKRLLDIDDVTGRSTDRWVIDFEPMTNRSQVSLFELPFEYVETAVKLFRFDSEKTRSDEDRLKRWYWLFQRPRPHMRRALSALHRFIIIPETAEHRIIVWGDPRDLIQGSLFAIAREDDVSFGILNSRFHDAWATRQGNRLGIGNQRRYNVSRTFETYPFPEGLTPNIPADAYAEEPRASAIARAARHLNDLRNNWLNPPDLVRVEPEVVAGYPDRILPKDTVAAAKLRERTLTKLYNERPQWLVDAHRDLDAAVAAAYGWPADISEEDALARLLELNLARAGASQPVPLGFAEEAPETTEEAILGREQFAKISEVEGIQLSEAATEALAEFDRKGLSPEERRRAIIGRFKTAGK